MVERTTGRSSTVVDRVAPTPTAASATTDATPATIHGVRDVRVVRAAAAGTIIDPYEGVDSAAANSAAVPKRSAGSLESAVVIAASTCEGTVARVERAERGASVNTRATIACAVGPLNGGSPVSIS